MREYNIDASDVISKYYDCPIGMKGEDDKGNIFDVGNCFLRMNNKPWFAVCGEAHFSRINEKLWEDEIIKMKLGGLNIIASYIFWIHHEEIEGEFDWTGNKNLRQFIELCKKHSMYVILRIGPFSHGECRNGGFPDWLYGRPFDIRSNDPEYLRYTKRFYEEIAKQAEGLLFKDGGPVIGVQLENEYEHASCPWEMTTENSKEWVVSGHDGRCHMAKLRELAEEVGFDVPFFTTTAWGGACAPEDIVFPLWGGYAFRPWMFYDGKLKEHPATAEYLYGDFHSNSAPKYYNFDPEYPAEDYPYACCEMGGGMQVYYPYRFQLPYESVGALAQVKVGSGCNFLGYYMYHGGTHPKGKLVPYLNECDVPKFSYDYQAPLGEFGQVRPSFHYLKLQHLFYREFADVFALTKTRLSKEAEVQQPEDTETLRYVVRVDNDGRGFLFINNYQDHAKLVVQKDFAISVKTKQGCLRIPENGSLNLAEGAYAILPFNLSLGPVKIKYATVQLVTKTINNSIPVYLFTAIEGMKAEVVFKNKPSLSVISGGNVNGNKLEFSADGGIAEIETESGRALIQVLSVDESMKLWQIDAGERKLFLSPSPVLHKDGKYYIEYQTGSDCSLGIAFSDSESISVSGQTLSKAGVKGIFTIYSAYHENAMHDVDYNDCSSRNDGPETMLKRPVVGSPVKSTKVVNARATMCFTPDDFKDAKQLILSIEYEGDVGYAFINGKMFHDNFSNGRAWEIDLMPYKDEILANGMYIYISPHKEGSYIDSSSAMAAMVEVAGKETAKLISVSSYRVENLEFTF
ncbi:MAG: beta-galactosidase [Spirochaetes bacterium]|uniref:Beta-galactosidase n=1 Tax=Candidatus Ornithospirochaeta stercoripullorum TaxID=2840899 RepID=A0A9D9E3L9_9SPIO|nr:beta-galactosidase [Candidatus Ornithospirochaeta stercoripullorum]